MNEMTAITIIIIIGKYFGALLTIYDAHRTQNGYFY